MALALTFIAVILISLIVGYYFGYDEAKGELQKKEHSREEKRLSVLKKLEEESSAKKAEQDVNSRLKEVLKKESKPLEKIEITENNQTKIIDEKVRKNEPPVKAVKRLSEEGIKTNVTLCFSSNQALLAAKAGGTYVSPFVGRLDDRGHVGMDLIEEIRTIYDNYGYQTEIIVASIRNPIHVRDAALMGADVATIPFNVFDMLVQHPLTDDGVKRFLADWEKVPKK